MNKCTLVYKTLPKHIQRGVRYTEAAYFLHTANDNCFPNSVTFFLVPLRVLTRADWHVTAKLSACVNVCVAAGLAC